MKQKNINWLLASVLFVFVWSACDKIEEPLSLVNEQDINLDLDLPFDSVVVNYKQVLLEDFTGIKCVNCPTAAVNAHILAEEKDHKLIIYSVHAGFYAEPDETGHFTDDFRCETGNEIFNNFPISGWPAGTVNRVEYDDNVILSGGDWEAAVNTELDKENALNMTLKKFYDEEKKELTVLVESTFLSDFTEEDHFTLVVLIVEDHILSWQRNNNEDIGPVPDWEDYEQRNILRDGISSAFGNYFTIDGTIVSGETYETPFSYTLNDDWVTENCNIISYIIHQETGEILQVAEIAVITE